jgi:hypothetical protein
MAWQNGKFIPEEAIGQQYKFADNLQNQKWSPTWAGVLAAGLGGLGSGIHRNSAQNALTGNQSLMSQALRGVGDANTLEDAQKSLMTSGVPSLEQSGAESRLKTLSDDPNKEYRVRAAQWLKMGYTPETAGYKEWVLTGKLPGAEDGSRFGMAGQTFQAPDGRFFTVQFGRDGTRQILPVELPAAAAAPGEGTVPLSPAKGVSEVDTGTGTRIIDKSTGKDVREISKDIRGAEAEKEIGTAVGKATASAPSDIDAANNALDIVKSLRDDPNREAGTGASALLNVVPATPGYDYQNKVDQAKSGAFLTAIQQMRGLGALSNAEGDTATKAVTRMNTATSEGAFLEALNDYEKIIRQGLARAQKRLKDQPSGNAPSTEGWSIQRVE